MQNLKQSRPVPEVSTRQIPLTVRVGEGTQVSVTGDFTDWSPEGIPMKRLADGRYRVLLRLAPGSYQYRVIVDGAWTNDLDSDRRVSNPFGSENSVLEVT